MDKKATLTIDGADFEIDANIASIVKAHLGRKDQELKAMQSKLDEVTISNDSLSKERDTAQAERDSAAAERDSLKTKLETADSVDINKLVAERQAFLDRAKLVMSEDSFDSVKEKSDLEIMRAACEKSGTTMTQDSDGYVAALFDLLVSQAEQTNDSQLIDMSLNASTTPTRKSEQSDINKKLREIRAAQ